MNKKFGSIRSILLRTNSNDHIVSNSHRENRITKIEAKRLLIPMIINMFSNKIHTTRSTDVKIRITIILLSKQSIQFIETFCNFWDIVINIRKTAYYIIIITYL